MAKQLGQGVMLHPFFEGVSFEEVEALCVEAPWRPEQRCPGDTAHFERFVEAAEPHELLRAELQHLFADF